mgnify:CR=1 FL=1
MNDWIEICRIDEIPMLGARRVARPRGLDVAVFRTADDRVFALLDRCPHKGGPLSQATRVANPMPCPRPPPPSGPDAGRAQPPAPRGRPPTRRPEALALDVARPPAGPACRDATCA